MSMPFRRSVVGDVHVHRFDDQAELPTHLVAFPDLGGVMFHQATLAMVGVVDIDGRAGRIGIAIGRRGCPCGCGAVGMGLVATPDAAAARELAAQLIELAEQQERAANVAADAAIAAAWKRP